MRLPTATAGATLMRWRPPVCVATAALVAAVFPGAAFGGTVTVVGGSVSFANSVGERNDVTVTSGPGTIVFTEAGSEPIGGSCSGSGTQQVTCDAAGTTGLQLQGGNLDDSFTNTTALPAQLLGGSGGDTLRGGPANEQLDGGAGPDDVDGGGGNDVAYGATLQDAAAGNDSDRLAGGPGDDRLFGSGGADSVDGGPGADRLDGAGGVDVLQGAEGTDSLSGADGDDTVDGGSGDDALTGGQGNDTLSPGPGPSLADADTISGGAGLDTVSYAARMAPVDVSKDGVANDGGVAERDDVQLDVEVVSGGLASDALRGGPGADVLMGASGDDTLSGGPGADQLTGGPGTDTVAYADEPGVSVRLESGTGTTAVPGDRDALQEIENVDGGSLQDTVVGSAAANVLQGEAGEDYLDGLRGRDRFDGGPGADLVVARDGARNEPVSCGRGRDFAVIDPGDRVVQRGTDRCERVDDGSAARPSRGWVYLHPRRNCAEDARLRLPAQHRLVPLRYSILLPSGFRRRPSPTVDAAACTVRLRAPLGRGGIASADVSGGAATVDQLPGRLVTTELTVKRPACGRATLSAAPIREPRVRVSTRRPHGRFRVRGNYSLGASFGTDWTTIDACSRTTTIVRRGRVKVFDRVKRRTVMVSAGHRYVARRASPSG